MSEQGRPMRVTLIGLAWVILGGVMCFTALRALLLSALTQSQARTYWGISEVFEFVPAFLPFRLASGFGFSPVLLPIQLGIGILGVNSGANFLKLKKRARNVLEVLTWLLLIFVVAHSIFWTSSYLSDIPRYESPVFAVMGIVMGLLGIVIYGVPLGIMVMYLRGNKVRDAMQ